MPFALAILLFIAFVCLESSEKSARNKIDKSWEDNYVAGYREYVYAWYIYWDEVVPKTYEKYKWLMERENWVEAYKQGVSNVTNPRGVYPGEGDFNKVADYIYAGDHIGYCTRKAKERMVAEGRRPYNACWERDYDKYKLSQRTVEEWQKPINEMNLKPLFRLSRKFHDPDAYISPDDDIRHLIPPQSDRRRHECVALDGVLIIPLSLNTNL